MNTWRHLRRNLFDLSQREFADAAGVNQSTVSRWEKGELHPTYLELVRIRNHAKAMGLDWNDLLFFEPNISEAAA